jgi:hypothetical protein
MIKTTHTTVHADIKNFNRRCRRERSRTRHKNPALDFSTAAVATLDLYNNGNNCSSFQSEVPVANNRQNRGYCAAVSADGDVGAVVVLHDTPQSFAQAQISLSIAFPNIRIPELVVFREPLLEPELRECFGQICFGASAVTSMDSESLAQFLFATSELKEEERRGEGHEPTSLMTGPGDPFLPSDMPFQVISSVCTERLPTA